jgi:predicted KAP-like P-loop ATPase
MSSSESEKVSQISPDRPGEDPVSDRLGYAPFAKHLADSILRLPSSEGLVIALYGAWGTGKTTMLNYVRHYIRQSPPDQQPTLVAFNPWWFSGNEDLIRAFFGQLQAHLGTAGGAASSLRNKLADFSEAVSEVPLPYTGMGKATAKVLRTKPKDVTKLKAEISKALAKREKRILVTIDDIDRLAPNEVHAVFQVVKAVADFPNITYLMAFDKTVVTQSLEYLHSGTGDDYLEKIVQVPFELPLADRLSIRNLFFERLTILAEIEPKTIDKTYLGNMFFEGIDKFLETPRDVVRLTNALSVTFRAVLGEVNPVDFIAIECLRLFCPDVYQTVRSNSEMFTGGAPTDYVRPTREELSEFHNGWLTRLRASNAIKQRPVQEMLKRLFPKLESVWGNTSYGGDYVTKWSRELRICDEDVFPVYFALAVNSGEISNSEMQTVLANTGDSEWLSSELLKLAHQIRPDGKTRVSALLEKLQDYTHEGIPIENIEPILLAFSNIGNQLFIPEDRSSSLLGYGNDTRMGRVTWQLLKRLDPDRRFEVLRRAVESGRALSFVYHAVIVLGQQQGKYGESQPQPEREWFITREQLSILEGLVLERIRNASRDGSLSETPTLPLILNFWRANATQEEVAIWVSQVVKGDQGLVKLLEGYLQTTASAGLDDAVVRRTDRLDPEWLRSYLDPEQIVDRVRGLLQNAKLPPRQNRALAQFLKEYDLRQRGGNPGDPFAQFGDS